MRDGLCEKCKKLYDGWAPFIFHTGFVKARPIFCVPCERGHWERVREQYKHFKDLHDNKVGKL